MEEVEHECYIEDGEGVEKVKIWNEEYVPILLKEINFDGIKIPSFVSVRPISDYDSMAGPLKSNFPLEIYYSPHIRGVFVEKTDDFVFWNPFFIYGNLNCWGTYTYSLKEEEMKIILQPVSTDKFYKNLMKSLRRGKRTQKKLEKLEFEDDSRVVPYYEFDSHSRNYTIYPAKILEG
ncbi:hypothetical protein J4477_03625, partial [Candidatus Pacearchaeota archaeon]|nr:hypothetical protein [Candidatus Pacearchaeota archaeon]